MREKTLEKKIIRISERYPEGLKRDILLYSILFILFIPIVIAQQQSHPLSEITPIDINLNMSGYNITNVSYIGIGLNNPLYSLDIVGDVRWTGTLQGGNVPWSRLINFPVGCSKGYAVRVIGSTLTCEQINTTAGVGNISGVGINGEVAFWVDSNTLEGSSELFWDNINRRLGIGTSSPTARLEIENGSDNGLSLNVSDDLFVNDTSGKVGIGISNPTYDLDVSGDARITGDLNVNGFVGIGVDNPSYELEVAGNAQVWNIYPEESDSYGLGSDLAPWYAVYANVYELMTSTTYGGFIYTRSYGVEFRVLGSDNMLKISSGVNSASGLEIVPAGDNQGSLGSPSYRWQDLHLGRYLNMSTTLFVNGTSGNIGIGTINPTDKLYISSGANKGLTIEANTPRILLDDTTGSYTDDFEIRNGGDYVSFRDATDNIDIITIGLGINEGNVGIGTNSPNYKLDVEGNVSINGTLYLDDNMIRGGYIRTWYYTASPNLLKNGGGGSKQTTVWTKLASIRVPPQPSYNTESTFNITWECRGSSVPSSSGVETRIYRNGEPVSYSYGCPSDAYEFKKVTISGWKPGDYIEVWGRADSGYVMVQNFCARGDINWETSPLSDIEPTW